MDRHVHIWTCDYFYAEVEQAIETLEEVTLHRFPAECDHPQHDMEPWSRCMAEHPGHTLIIEGGCLAPLRAQLQQQGGQLTDAPLCFELLAGASLLDEPMQQGAHLLTPGMLKVWREKMASWGVNVEKGEPCFGGQSHSLLLLDTGTDDDAESELSAFAEKSGLPAQRLPIGLDLLKAKLAAQIYQLRNSHCHTTIKKQERSLADAAMMVALTAQLTQYTREDAVGEALMQLCSMLCAPHRLTLLLLDEAGRPATTTHQPDTLTDEASQALVEQLQQVQESGAIGEDGFDLVISHQGARLGILRVSGLAFPEQRDRYLNQALQISPVAGLAVANARTLLARERDAQQIAELNQDLTHRLAELNAANEELEAFTYSVSHDLRGPLRAIDGFSAALVKDIGEQLEESPRHYLNRLRAGAVRMGELIDDLLKLSRSTRGELQRQACDLTAIAQEILADCQAKEPQRQAILTVEEGLTAEADPRFLRVVLENLLGNAWKYCGQQSTTEITIHQEGDGFTIQDNGAGFDMAFSERLFQPFQRLHDAKTFEGSGIGLSTVKRIIQRHGGTITAQSEPGKGAQFHFTLS
uniref:histidine kinase n=1 Tax=Magnetococcus massalia (strain MO-1) TaxID=451514 RepID=A0A1S7LKJ6_MAGMO|nr:putative Histidine kinase [Candidatus Magnetococcus massalia]